MCISEHSAFVARHIARVACLLPCPPVMKLQAGVNTERATVGSACIRPLPCCSLRNFPQSEIVL